MASRWFVLITLAALFCLAAADQDKKELNFWETLEVSYNYTLSSWGSHVVCTVQCILNCACMRMHAGRGRGACLTPDALDSRYNETLQSIRQRLLCG